MTPQVPRGAGSLRRWTAARLLAVAALAAGMAAVVPVLASTPAGAEALTPVITGVSDVTGVAVSSGGDIFVSDTSDVYVWSTHNETVFGVSVPAETLTPVLSELPPVNGIALDSSGNLWVAEYGAVRVLSDSTGTLYGVPVTSDVLTTVVSSLPDPTGIAFDASGNLFVSDGSAATVSVLANYTETLFGTPVVADDLTTLVSGLSQPVSLAFDAAGNLYVSDYGASTVSVLPLADGTLFGTAVTADSLTVLESGLNSPGDLAFDGAGNLYVVDGGGVAALSDSSGTLFGTTVPADTATPLALEVNAAGIAFDGSGHLLLSDGEDNAVVEASPTPATVLGVSVTGPQTNPDVTITGTGFGASPPASVAAGCSATGVDYPYSAFTMSDTTQGWQAGVPGDCIGFNVVSWSDTQIVVTFGSWYTGQEVTSGTELQPGDGYVVGVLGSYSTGTVPLAPAVSGVSPSSGSTAGGTVVNLSGTGFTGASAVYFGTNPASTFHVNSDGSIQAVAPAGPVGTVDVRVTTTWGTSPIVGADQYAYDNPGQTAYLCTVPGLGAVDFPVGVSGSPAPPSSIAVGATFQTTLGAQVTVPATAVDYYRGLGATSLTAVGQVTSEAGLTALNGPPSGAVTPSTQSASATDLPQSFTLSAGTPVTYQTTYNPVTWQTGPGTGTVVFSSGTVAITVTYVVGGLPVTQTISCSPQTAGSLGSTLVQPAPPTPTVQVPPSTPPVQAQVTAGSDDGWSLTVTNTSAATVKGLAASLTVGDGGPPPPFDLAAIAAAGTKGCSSPSAGVLDCAEPNLAPGASTTIDGLVATGGLSPGTQVSGSATVTATNAGTQHSALGVFTLVTVPNGVIAVATPGTPLASSSAPLSVALAEVTLKLPKTKVPATPAATVLAGPISAAGKKSVAPPVVGVTLEPLAPSTEPGLCPPVLGGCKGDIIQVQGNFSQYVNSAHPVSAVVEIYYGASVPPGSMYMLKPTGAVVKLPACAKVGGGYVTPCVKGKEKVVGAPGGLATQDTVYFTGGDPAMGRR